MSTQQIYAPRNCGSCAEFKKLTTQFEKDVIDAASVSPPEPYRIQTLLDQYNDDVMELFRTPSTSPNFFCESMFTKYPPICSTR